MKKRVKKKGAQESIDEENISTSTPFPIVGVGASAGGLAAFEALFSGMPKGKDLDMAFLFMQHLSPDHKSSLAELLGKYTHMNVCEVEDGMQVKVNCVYIIPPGYDMALLNGVLHLFEPPHNRSLRLPIDFFFRSLSQDQCEKTVAIVLSGSGSDGTAGLRSVKGGGGMVIVQTPESAEYESMPRNAVATGLADHVLPPVEIGSLLTSLAIHLISRNKYKEGPGASSISVLLNKIFILIYARTGHDFSAYKLNTIRRRVERRMVVHQIDSIKRYIDYLQQSDVEIDALFNDCLIGVTNFFRDTHAFDFLNENVIHKILFNRDPGSIIRIWSAGCSTGEEAYSLAILLQEYLDSINQSYSIQIFATDIDPNAIAVARVGSYAASVLDSVSKERLERFFSIEQRDSNGGIVSYRITKKVRDMIIFSEQNVVKDPPFSRIDLISCRNLLIYLGGALQKKLFPLFHYALNPGGVLFLGTSETIGEFSDLFKLLDRKSKIYQKKESKFSGRWNSINDIYPLTPKTSTTSANKRSQTSEKLDTPKEIAEKTLLKFLGPPSALVNDKGDIFYLNQRTGMYLEPAVGEVGSYNIFKMAREGLRVGLLTSLRKAVQTHRLVSCQNLQVKSNGSFISVDLTIIPAVKGNASSYSQNMYLVIFEDRAYMGNNIDKQLLHEPPELVTVVDENEVVDSELLISSLRKELQIKDEYLQSTIEELEISNEELKSSNEELQSVNEELQSTNEELETSKEELQSVNEEITTVNTELSANVSELTRLNNDMNNLLAGTGIGTVFVNHQHQIINFTPTISELINLIQSDIGRPISHILTNLVNYSELTSDIQSVLDTLIPKEIKVQTTKNKWFRMNILPYRTLENTIEGAVITFVDITELNRLNDELQMQLLEKNILLREVYHRVRNNIFNIENFLKLQSGDTNNSEVRIALVDVLSRVQSIRVLYDKMLLADIYDNVSMKKYMESLLHSILTAYDLEGVLQVEKTIPEFIVNSKKAVSIGILVNELVTNSIKYAFKSFENAKIGISIRKIDNLVELVIDDNGNGMIDEKKESGLGLTIVKMLIEQLKGTYKLNLDKGTRWEISLQIDEEEK
jgi:two-component system CheB/CheR fusion protein